MLTKKMVFCITIIIIIILAILLLLIFRHYKIEGERIKPIGENINKSDIEHDLKYYIDKRLRLKNINIPLLNSESKVMYIDTKINSPKYNKSDVFEVKEAVRAWLYLTERKLSNDIVINSIIASATLNGVMAKVPNVRIDKDEFMTLYNIFKGDSTNNELIEMLSSKWMENHNYRAWWLNVKKVDENGVSVYP